MHLGSPLLALSLIGQRPAPQDHAIGKVIGKPMLRSEGERCFRTLTRCGCLAAKLMARGHQSQDMRKAVEMAQLLGQRACLVALLQGLLRIAEQPERPGVLATAAHTGIMTSVERGMGLVLMWVVQCNGMRKVGMRS